MKTLKRALIIVAFGAVTTITQAQNIGINATGTAPDASAGLDVDFTNKGVLIPRVALTSTGSATPVTSPATSLLVYNTATAGDVTPGYYYWNGTQWVRLLNTGNTSGTEWLLAGNSGTTAGTDFLGTTDAQDLVLKTNNTEKMRILTNGNVGIGTASPTAKLHVNGSVQIENAPTGTNNKNPIRGMDFGDTTHSSYYYPTAPTWTDSPHVIDLPEAGTYFVIYNAEFFRSSGTRSDQSSVRLSTTTGGVSPPRGLAGVSNNTAQFHGTVTIVHVFTVTTADTVVVQAQDPFGGSFELRYPSLVYIRIG